MSKKHTLRLVLWFILVILVLAACAPATSPSAAAPQEVQRVSLEESKGAFDNNSAIFLDVRSEEAYATGHIPGALSIPLDDLEGRLTELDPDRWTITYCT